jgi:hypothetical protein
MTEPTRTHRAGATETAACRRLARLHRATGQVLRGQPLAEGSHAFIVRQGRCYGDSRLPKARTPSSCDSLQRMSSLSGLMKAVGLLGCVVVAAAFPNMNLQDYVISPTPGPNKVKGTYNTKWSEYPDGGVESFDVYMGPITHRYGEVWWTSLPEARLPPDLVKRFDGKGMAIMGYEVDQVRRKGDKDFDGSILQEDVSVPINMAYNHHHDATVLGKGSHMEKVRYDPQDRTIPSMMRSDPNFITVPVSHTPSKLGIPTHAHLAAGNGGEYRGSYHGFASPVAYVIDSPSSVHVLPMQIDTWNRDEMSPHGNGASATSGHRIPVSQCQAYPSFVSDRKFLMRKHAPRDEQVQQRPATAPRAVAARRGCGVLWPARVPTDGQGYQDHPRRYGVQRHLRRGDIPVPQQRLAPPERSASAGLQVGRSPVLAGAGLCPWFAGQGHGGAQPILEREAW